MKCSNILLKKPDATNLLIKQKSINTMLQHSLTKSKQ